MAARLGDQFTGSAEVQPRHRFDEKALRSYFAGHVSASVAGFRVSQFRGGQSNPTFLIEAGGRGYVMRRKPPGTLLPSAHAVDREYRVMKALQGTAVPVPKVYALCEDPEVIGTAFYLMEFVDGRVLWDPALPELSVAERGLVYAEMNRVIAALHDMDVTASGLEDFGRPDNYVARQVSRWTKQYRASETEAIDAMDRLIAWLPAHMPPTARSSIVHGDFRLDNLVFSRSEPRLLAVLDWELSTIGDPMADFAYHCMAWRLPAASRGLGDLSASQLALSGIPSEYVHKASYHAARGLPLADPKTWSYYMAFNLFRSAAIAQGIMQRALSGSASSPHAVQTGQQARIFADLACRQIDAAESGRL
jgi:aminoglycoside phosphotransferase (APT) family kinase protein